MSTSGRREIAVSFFLSFWKLFTQSERLLIAKNESTVCGWMSGTTKIQIFKRLRLHIYAESLQFHNASQAGFAFREPIANNLFVLLSLPMSLNVTKLFVIEVPGPVLVDWSIGLWKVGDGGTPIGIG